MQMYRKISQLKNTSDVTINPATETTLAALVDATVYLAPVSASPVSVTSTASAYTLTTGNSLVVQNVGTKIVYWGGSTVDSTKGIKMVPTESLWFRGCESGFKIYFATNGADTSTVNVCEL